MKEAGETMGRELSAPPTPRTLLRLVPRLHICENVVSVANDRIVENDQPNNAPCASMYLFCCSRHICRSIHPPSIL